MRSRSCTSLVVRNRGWAALSRVELFMLTQAYTTRAQECQFVHLARALQRDRHSADSLIAQHQAYDRAKAKIPDLVVKADQSK